MDMVVTTAMGADIRGDLKETQRWCAAFVVSRSEKEAKRQS